MLNGNAQFQALRARFSTAAAAAGMAREPRFTTGVDAIDRLVNGGLPAGALVTFEGRSSAGCRSLAAALLAAATRRGLGAVIDQGDLYPPDLEAAGVRLERLLIVPARTPVGAARAADLLLRSRIARIVVMGATALRAAVWRRLATLAQKAGAVLVVLGSQRLAADLGAAAAMRVGCRIEAPRILGNAGLWGLFTGFDVRTDVRKQRRVAV